MASPFGGILDPEDMDFEEIAQDLRENYEALEAQDIDPVEVMPQSDEGSLGVDVANILFGDEMSSLGFELDERGLDWSIETAKNFWVEHPVRAGLAVATSFLPMAAAARKAFKAGKTFEYSDDIIRASGLLDEGVDLAMMSSKDRKLLESTIENVGAYRDRVDRVRAMGDAAPLKDRAWANLNDWFGNKYLEHTDPINAAKVQADWRKRTGQILADNGNFAYHLKNAPPDELGTPIAAYLADPARLNDIPKQYQPWAIKMADDLRTTQAQMIQEGLISADEAKNVGDVWFSTVRGTAQRDQGALTSILDSTKGGEARVLNIPRTRSVNLLGRKATQGEVAAKIDKQLSAELLSSGKIDEARSLLQGRPGFEDAVKLIDSGDTSSAIKLLTTGGKIDFSPKALTFGSLFEQKMLLENHRLIRDLAMNKDIVKTGDYIAALTPRARKQWENLDLLDNSDRVRRMIANKMGVDSVDSLGWVPKNVFQELRELTSPQMKSSTDGLLRLITAVHKTAKTAYNVPTHGSNVLGNTAFLVNAGVNPFSKDFLKLRARSWDAVAQLQKAGRSGQELTEIKNLGKLDSLVTPGRKLDIAEEMASGELRDLIELSSVVASEGLGVLQNLAKGEDFVGNVARNINKAVTNSKGYVPSDWYVREDAMDKMAYFLHLRQRGFSRAGAVAEVGRRMPMYNHVGSAVAGARSWALPWVTFPSEAMRILKNNMMDHPLKTAMMLQLPELAQVGVYAAGRAAGRGMSAESIQGRKEQLAPWANKPSTIITPLTDRNNDFRSMVLDFLPYTSVMPPTLSNQVGMFNKLPFGADDPMPLFSGLYMAMTGKDAWGREVATDPDQPMQKVAIMAQSLAGFVAPPIASKYLFNPTEIETGYRFMQDLGKNVNPYTDKPGDVVFDAILNNLSPIKSYPASAEQQLSNEAFSDDRRGAYRSKLTKEWSALLRSGDTESAAGRMREIMQTYSAQYPADPEMATREMAKWLKTHTRDLRKHPQLRNFSKKELQYRISEIEQNTASQRSNAQQQLLGRLRQALASQGRQSNDGRESPFSLRRFSNRTGTARLTSR